ncbi:acetyl-CoA carboxylase biotin carboxyl carrier protein subunit [Modestobacter sp. VKM Ac-2986]|uniref:acetyl-CoA carboxylase biotin carboxyl carrier protein n=1 Tax=Modestobacter sp. VKM Ac-2986 TaxID=3004140 RepID=UPI0022AAFDF1|nr:acetyl-CoA carboxylase biotin carboxyl carrier protein subunit [Modestobacter sp. VKM Ac-2986]MCZ2827242.1 acetyl-CoA carboxylase biotin carboxyl carrier protein subunit [Modestobacter sp. VKM Ac-2986]
MHPSEFAPRPVLSGAPVPADDTTRSLSEEVVELARSLPGDLRRLTVRSGDIAIEVEWAAEDRPAGEGGPALRSTPGGRDVPAGAVAPAVPDDVVAVTAPLVGTFYLASAPDADPFVRVGDAVEPGQTLAIVEAMKLMNPIVADEAGVVTEVLAGDAESVEYGQVLMYLRPTGAAQ